MKSIIFLIIPAAIIVLLLSSYSGNNSRYPNGAPAGYTGSPGDGQNCTSCHNGSASTADNWITSDIGAEGYIPGQTYTITVTVSGSGNKGFEVSPQNPSGAFLGTLIAGSGSKLVGSNRYITHTSASNSNPKVWTFQWTAPAAGSGPVTMYGAFALNKSVTKLSTMEIAENTTTAINTLEIPDAVSIYPNPADDHVVVSFSMPVNIGASATLVNAESGISYSINDRNAFEGNREMKLGISDLPSGIYILQIQNGDFKTESKILIRHP